VRTTMRRRLLSLGAAFASGAVLVGCGSAGIPADASVKDFCTASNKFATVTKFADGVKAADKLHDTGTPKSVPADARSGFELVVRLVTDSKNQAGLEKSYNKLTDAEKKSVDALDAYITKTC
jgi:hypothetical protein